MAALTASDRALRPLIHWNLAMADLLRGCPAKAEQRLTKVVRDRHLLSVRPWYDLGHVQQVQGRLGDALRTFGRAVAVASEAGHPLPLAGLGHVGLAEVRHERGELDAALEHGTRAVDLCRQLPYAQWLVTALTVLALIRQAHHDPAGAMAVMEEAARVAPSPDVAADMQSSTGVQQARLAVAQGRTADAARWLGERGVGVEDEPSYLREREQLVLARVLAGDQAGTALRLLARLHQLASEQGRVGSMAEVQALRALALAARHEEAGARDTLVEALALAAPEGYVRVFVEEGAPMAVLLGRYVTADSNLHPRARGLPRPAAHRVRAAGVPVLVRSRRGDAVAGLIEPLTARELQVLGLLATGGSNLAIAEELATTLDTVKRHVTHILGKLEAANRTQAVARARDLGLLR